MPKRKKVEVEVETPMVTPYEEAVGHCTQCNRSGPVSELTCYRCNGSELTVHGWPRVVC